MSPTNDPSLLELIILYMTHPQWNFNCKERHTIIIRVKVYKLKSWNDTFPKIKGNLVSFRKSRDTCHTIHSFWTTDYVVTEDFLSSAPKTSKRTRRPRPKPKTTPTTEAPQTKLGKCGFLVKTLSPGRFSDSGIGAHDGSDSLCERSVWVKAQDDVGLFTLLN